MKPSSGHNLSIALAHYPVRNKHGDTIASAVTNLDVHDLARLARTYEIERCYIVTPLQDQAELIQKLIDHWITGHGAAYNPKRHEALETIRLLDDLDQVADDVENRCGRPPAWVATAARQRPNSIGFSGLRERLKDGSPHVMVFGTAWGLTDDFLDQADLLLEPVRGPGDYNHLSVRAAAAIIIDRLLRPSE